MKKVLVIFILFYIEVASAEVYKCPTVGGSVKYTQIPCEDGVKKHNGEWVSNKKLREREVLKKQKEEKERLRLINIKLMKQQQKENLARIDKEEEDFQKEQKRKKQQEKEKKEKQIKEKARLRKASKLKISASQILLSNPEIQKAIKPSDDYYIYKEEFLVGAKKLIDIGWCSLKNFEYMGGWVESHNHIGKYFLYCGGINKVYLDTITDTISNKGKSYKIYLVDPS